MSNRFRAVPDTPDTEPTLTPGEARAASIRPSYRIACERCGEWADAATSRPVTHPRCDDCGPYRAVTSRRRTPPVPVVVTRTRRSRSHGDAHKRRARRVIVRPR
jgi:hypothetical protein